MAEKRLWKAAKGNKVDEVTALLNDHPEIDVNWANESLSAHGCTALHVACEGGYVQVVKLLLEREDIEVNQEEDLEGYSALSLACSKGRIGVVDLLLADPRVDAGQYGPPIWTAVFGGHLNVAEALVASSKDIGEFERDGVAWEEVFYGSRISEANKEKLRVLMENFTARPLQTRHDLRVQMGLVNANVAGHFASLIFLCDNLLQISPHLTGHKRARFFDIARRLPIELQMIICHRVMGSVAEIVSTVDSEGAFRSLAQHLLPEQ